jgi:tetratricopeptide (TPR) repeat protein
MPTLNKLVDKAYQLFLDKEYDSALEILEQVNHSITNPEIDLELTKEQENELVASVENFRGFNFLGKGDIENAKTAFEKSLELNPHSSQACAGLGEVFYLCNMDYEAKVVFEWALDNNPLNQLAKAGLAKINKNLQLAENHNTLNINTIVKKKKSFYSLLADAYQLFSEGEYHEALAKLDNADALFSKSLISKDSAAKIASLENFKGFNYLALKDYENAKLSFENALNLNPNSSQACAGLGELLFLDEKDDQAKTMFEWGLKHNPANQFALSGLEKVNQNLGLESVHVEFMN